MLAGKVHETVIAYIAANLSYRNAQRCGTIKNMTISEFKERVAKDGRLLIEVENHKTIAAFGPTNIVI